MTDQAEVDNLRRELAEVRQGFRLMVEWSNDLSALIPERCGDDVTQEAIIERWIRALAEAGRAILARARETRALCASASAGDVMPIAGVDAVMRQITVALGPLLDHDYQEDHDG